MPQPLKTKLGKFPNMQFFQSGGWKQRPQLAVLFAEAVEEFSVSEGALGNLYLVLNSNRPEEAFLELQEQINYSQRIKLVRESISSFQKEDRALLDAVMDRASQASGMRNKIVHCSWGYSDSLPNAVLRIPASSGLIETKNKLLQRLNLKARYQSSETDVLVYEARDFQDVYNAAIEATAPLDLAASYIMCQSQKKKNIKTQILSDPQTEKRYRKRIIEVEAQASGNKRGIFVWLCRIIDARKKGT